MNRIGLALPFFCTASLIAQQYTISTVAGSMPTGDGLAATSAWIYSPSAIAADALGNLYIAESSMYRVRKVAPDGTISTFAGTGLPGSAGDGGPAAAAFLNYPSGLAMAADGSLLIADSNNYRIRRITPDGNISTFAGTGAYGFGGDGGPATSARLAYPRCLAMDLAGNLYIGENSRIRKVTADGTISTVAGNENYGFLGDGGPATLAEFYYPYALAVDAAGNVAISDIYNNRIRQIGIDGVIRTIAGNGKFGSGSLNGDGGPALTASLGTVYSLGYDKAGNLLIGEYCRIRIVTSNGMIATLAGVASSGFNGDGPVGSSQIGAIYGFAADTGGNLLFADFSNDLVRTLALDSGFFKVKTIAGQFAFAGDGGAPSAALLKQPTGLALDLNGNTFFSDPATHRIRKISPAGVVSTVAGTGTIGSPKDGDPAGFSNIGSPDALVTDGQTNLYFIDQYYSAVYQISPAGTIKRFAGGGSDVSENAVATSAQLSIPSALAVDVSGRLYITEQFRHRIRRVDSTGHITTVAGNGTAAFSQDGGIATQTPLYLYGSTSLAVDAQNNIYFPDQNGAIIRRVGTDGKLSTMAGSGFCCLSGDGGAANKAYLSQIGGIVVDGKRNLFIAQRNPDQIRFVGADGIIKPIAGNGDTFSAGDNGPALQGSFDVNCCSTSIGMAVDGAGAIYFSDTANRRIRKLTPR